ncbi:putative allantoate permease of the major facilitator superfamily [Polychaeton citri CBS 116435]|uniref:Allantoate permease of the major facilitator superfamily n=1 Tax=Polychaeton citri CBS 116435 TaxID=1314669 RepID=A0A9P4QDE0_9PEZI|nr:putative allantoate permease of the major facilitator superfamily [Polychaeton citri CBS 116435]
MCSVRNVDATQDLVEKLGDTVAPLTPEKQRELKRTLYIRLMSLLIVINLWLFIDKATLSYGSLLGLMEETGINGTQYNDLATIFYTGYIVAQVPGHYLMQRLPLGRFVSVAIFLWSVIIFLHCTAESFGALVPLRFLLGVTEAVLVPAMEVTMGMFFTPLEYAEVQPIWWISCMACPIPAGFMAYGLLWSQSPIRPWKFFMITTGGVSLLLSIVCWFYYPDNPARARMLSVEDRIHVIRKVHAATRSSIEQKTVKMSQVKETLRDPVSWLFFLAAFCLMIANNLQYQQSLIFLGMGVSTFGSTLVSVAGGGVAVAACILGWLLLRWFPNKGAYLGTFFCLPSIACGIGMVALPWSNRTGLLACLTLGGNTFGVTYVIMLAWASSSAAGYTKKLLRNVFFMVGYGISNIISPQIWVSRDGPRYYGAWIAQILVSWVMTPVILLVIRYILSRRNAERRKWIAEQAALGEHGHGYVERKLDDGRVTREQVDVSILDLTDIENKFFIYPL